VLLPLVLVVVRRLVVDSVYSTVAVGDRFVISIVPHHVSQYSRNNKMGHVKGLSVQDNLQPTLDLLSELLLLQEENRSADRLRRVLLSHPQILGLSLENLRAKISYFDAIDRLAPDGATTSLASRVLIRAPAVYSLSLRDNIVPTVEYLARVWGTATVPMRWEAGFAVVDSDGTAVSNPKCQTNHGPSSLAALLGEYPSILTLSLKRNIQPTIGFYQRAGYLTLNDDHGRLTRSADGKLHVIRGRYIAVSLFNRLLPRWHYCLSSLASKEDPGGGAPDLPPPSPLLPLHVLAGTTDEGFCRYFEFDPQDYADFKEEATPRLKFSFQFDTWLSTGVPIDV